MPLPRLSHEARALVLCHPARLYRVLLVRLPPKSPATPGRMDTAGEGDGDKADAVSRDNRVYSGRERILLRSGWEAVQTLKADRVAPEKRRSGPPSATK